MTTKAELLEQKDQLDRYLTSKHKAGDWHAVADAAMDLREIDAKLEMLAEMPAIHPDVAKSINEFMSLGEHVPRTHLQKHQHEYKWNLRDDRFHCECGDSYPSSEQLTRPVQVR